MQATRAARRPLAGEYDAYYSLYVDQVPDGDIVELLRAQRDEIDAFLAVVPEEREEHRYAPGKWSLREVVGHTIDIEWIKTYRALRVGRGDATPLAGVEQDDLVAGTNHGSRRLADMRGEWSHLRAANLALFAGFDDEILARRGVASGCEFTTRALLYVIYGHARHHLRVLEERYL